jgi:HD superfamily phosphodiesterase
VPNRSEVGGKKAAALAELETWVRDLLETNVKRAHGWLHTDRVRANICILADAEGVDPFLAEIAALLHDVGRTQPGPEAEHGARSATIAEPLLESYALPRGEAEAILYAIRWHNSPRDDTPLLRILRDADMLDGLGAMGIMRAFMSKSHLPPYDSVQPFHGETNRWPPTYSSDQLLGQMEWYDQLNTGTARLLAKKRIDFMTDFINQARDEIMLSAGGQISKA